MGATWDDPGQVVWNVFAFAIVFAALVALVAPRSRNLRRGWPSKVLWALSFLVGIAVDGYYLPFGPMMVLWQLTRGWRRLNSLPPKVA